MPEEESLSLSTLPLETLLDDILPNLPARDLINLTQCNKFFATLCSDNTLWKHKLEHDYNFTGEGTARTSGWKFLYRGMHNPKVYVWGEKTSGRLGLESIPQSSAAGVPYPVQLRMPGIRIVNLVAGGMSFHALDSNGNVHVWGTLNGQMFASDTQGFSNSGKKARIPHQLSLPVAIRSISCGRLHSSCLDRNNYIWTFTNWGRPFKLASAILRDPEFTPKQVECGWTFSTFLTESGDVFAWWPSEGRMGEIVEQKMTDMDAVGEKKAHASAERVVPCVPWNMEEMPARLPAIPSLPELPHTGNTSQSSETQLIQIAAFDQHIIGLTNRGHVLKLGPLHNESGVADARWEYLPNFSELMKIREQPAFLESEDGKNVSAPPTMQITHITANFEHFVAYSTGASSIVLLGNVSTATNSQPQIIPELQHRSVISVVVGDYHNAAVTADGKLLTWGSFSHGALGLGDPLVLQPGTPGGFVTERDRTLAARSRRAQPPAVNIPTEVRFDHHSKSPRQRYCVSATAAGWHTGALVIDLEPGSDDNSEDEAVNTAQADVVQPMPPTLPSRSWETPPFVPLPGIIRVGFAGRGRLQRGSRGGPLRHVQPRPPNQGDTS